MLLISKVNEKHGVDVLHPKIEILGWILNQHNLWYIYYLCVCLFFIITSNINLALWQQDYIKLSISYFLCPLLLSCLLFLTFQVSLTDPHEACFVYKKLQEESFLNHWTYFLSTCCKVFTCCQTLDSPVREFQACSACLPQTSITVPHPSDVHWTVLWGSHGTYSFWSHFLSQPRNFLPSTVSLIISGK